MVHAAAHSARRPSIRSPLPVSSTGPAFTRAVPPPQPMTFTTWLIVIIAVIGFAFDTYELLVWPLITRPALAELLHVDRYTDAGTQAILYYGSWVTWSSAICGGVFGLLGGLLVLLAGQPPARLGEQVRRPVRVGLDAQRRVTARPLQLALGLRNRALGPLGQADVLFGELFRLAQALGRLLDLP